MPEAAKNWVVVTGAGGALGSLLARRYAALGSSVLALDQDAARLDAIGTLPKLVTASADLAVVASLEDALDRSLPRGARIDLLVNAVGLISNEPILSIVGARLAVHTFESFEAVIRANLTAAFVAATRVAARMARTGGGVIVNFSSIAAHGVIGQAAYSAAKAGVEGLTRAMAKELGPFGIRVNAIAPGFIDVATTRAAVSDPALAEYVRATPVGRLGTVEELAAAIDCLAANTFLTGAVLPLDGGLRV